MPSHHHTAAYTTIFATHHHQLQHHRGSATVTLTTPLSSTSQPPSLRQLYSITTPPPLPFAISFTLSIFDRCCHHALAFAVPTAARRPPYLCHLHHPDPPHHTTNTFITLPPSLPSSTDAAISMQPPPTWLSCHQKPPSPPLHLSFPNIRWYMLASLDGTERGYRKTLYYEVAPQCCIPLRCKFGGVITVKETKVDTARPKVVFSAVKGNKGNVVKASACWVWRPKLKVLDHGNPQQFLKDKGVIDSRCSRHMTRNRSYLSDYEEIDGGFVAFEGNSKGGKITRKDFKLTDESHVLLKVPRKDNMYSVDLKNVVPQGGLTCLFAKATTDESNLWHRRLGHGTPTLALVEKDETPALVEKDETFLAS
ncbi:hypothetical protein Tco_0573511 [Tanacetum coccineum]